jgi:hypothetical protein
MGRDPYGCSSCDRAIVLLGEAEELLADDDPLRKNIGKALDVLGPL